MTLGPAYPAALRAYDYAAAASLGAVAALGSWWIVPHVLPVPLAMILGMIIGTVASVPVFILFSWMLGGFEIVMLAMQIGMIAGMGAPMIANGTAASVAAAGAGAGLVIQLLLHALDRSLHGEVTP